MKRFWSMVIGCTILMSMVSLAACGVSAKGGSTADATSTNADGVVVAATEKASGIAAEDLTNGVIYNRSDMSDAFWGGIENDSVNSRLDWANIRFEDTMTRPFVNEDNIQIAQTYSFYLQASDMYLMTVNKDNVFYMIKDTVLSESNDIEMAYLQANLYYYTLLMDLVEYDDDTTNSYDKLLARQERDGEKYTTKELNGWRVVLTEATYRSDSGEDVPGFCLNFFYELNEYYFITAEARLMCDQDGADLFIDKFVNDFVIEKVSDSEGVAGVKIDNFEKIKLSDNITLNLENGINFGVLRADNLYATMINFMPNALTFDGEDTTYVKVVELDKSLKDTVYADSSYEYRDFTYKGIKTTLKFYSADASIWDAVSGEETQSTAMETRLECILFETDSRIYGLYTMSGLGEVTTDQDYEAYVTLVMDRLLEVT